MPSPASLSVPAGRQTVRGRAAAALDDLLPTQTRRALKADQQRLNKLESSIAVVLVRLSTLELARPRGLRSPVVTSGVVDRLLRTAYRIHALGDGVAVDSPATDVAIEIARNKDGSVVVFPALAA